MLRDVTLGQYYSEESFVHRLDPRVKIRFTIIYILLLLLDRNVPLFAGMTVIFLCELMLSRVPLGHMVKGCRGIFIFIVICSGISIFTTPGAALGSLFGLNITKEGLIKFGFLLWRMVLILFVSSLIMYTTTPTGLTDGLEKCLHLSGTVAMSITIGLRFIPVLFEELDRIMKAQEARGADFERGGPVKRLKAMKTVIIPLFSNAVRRAANLGEAMDARCYKGGKERTRLKPLKYRKIDFAAYLFLMCMTVAGVYLAVKF